jgi:hypothetical protein
VGHRQKLHQVGAAEADEACERTIQAIVPLVVEGDDCAAPV